MRKAMDEELQQRLEDQPAALCRIGVPRPAQRQWCGDGESAFLYDKALAALIELQLKKQQQSEIGFWKFKASGPVTWLIVIAFAFIVWVIAPHLGGWIHEWRSMKAAVARMQAVEAQAAPVERESP